MSHEEQAIAGQFLPEAGVVERRHDRLAGPSRGDEEVPVVAALARQRDLLQQSLLEGFWPEFGRKEDRRAGPSGSPGTS